MKKTVWFWVLVLVLVASAFLGIQYYIGQRMADRAGEELRQKLAEALFAPRPRKQYKDEFEAWSWREKAYFDAPRVIALCEAIQNHDVEEVERYLAAGNDPNPRGRANMTPLLWALVAKDPGIFELLLEYGADPNITFEDHFNSRGVIPTGSSVLHLSIEAEPSEYFDLVMQHGGDPNLENPVFCSTPLSTAVKKAPADCATDRVRILLEAGADMAHQLGGYGETVLMLAVAQSRYEVAQFLLDAGADHTIQRVGALKGDVVLYCVSDEEKNLDEKTMKDRQAFMEALEAKGVDFEAARAELQLRQQKPKEIRTRHEKLTEWGKRAHNAPWLGLDKTDAPE